MNITKKIAYILITAHCLAFPNVINANGKDLNFASSVLDPLKNNIISNGLTFNYLDSYKFILFNGVINIEKELNFVNSLPPGIKKQILLGFIFKKKADLESEYITLKTILNNIPEYIEYYDELISSAKAMNKLDELNRQLAKSDTTNKYLLYAKALSEYYSGNYATANRLYKKLIESGFNNISVYYRYSYSLRNEGDYPSALEQLKKARQLNIEKKYLPKFLNAEGSLYYLSGKYKAAETLYRKARKLAEEKHNNYELIKSLVNLAIIADEKGKLASARELFKNALSIAQKINALELKALIHSELGVSFTYDTRLVEAERHYEKSLQLYRLLNDKNRLAILHANLGNVYSALSNYKFALKAFEKGLVYAGENKRSQILNLTGMGDVYANLSNYSKSLFYYNRAKKLAMEIKEISTLAEIEYGLGILELNLELPNKALHYFENARKISENLNNSFFKAELLHKSGVAHFLLGNFESAEKFLTEANIINSGNGDIYNQIAVNLDLSELLLNKNKFKQALELLQNTGILCKKYNLTHLLAKQNLILAEFYRSTGNYKKAIEILNNALRLSKGNHDFNTLIETNFLLGKLFERTGKTAKAKHYFLEAKNVLENVSRPMFEKSDIQISYYSSFNQIYKHLAKLYINEKNYEAAFELIDFQRSRNTSQNLNNLKVISATGDEQKLKRLYELDWMIASGIVTDTSAEKKEYDELKLTLAEKNPGIKTMFGFDKYQLLEELQNKLDSSESFISYYISGNFTQIFQISKNNFNSIKINITRDSLTSLIKSITPFYRETPKNEEIFFNQDLFSFNSGASFSLYKIIFEPVLKYVNTKTKLIFSLPPDMLKIPFEFLVTNYQKNKSPYNYNEMEFLINRFSISYVPSGHTLINLKEKNRKPNKINLLIGNPRIKNSNFIYSIRGSLFEDTETLLDINLESLDYSEKEIREINNFVGNSEIFLAETATEKNFKQYAPLSKIIHLSTHSFLYKNQPLIVFSSEDGGSDGLLERGEIIQLKLSADMVVLSSCKSGLGEIDKTEGVLGMQKSFLDAGANSVIVSLWDVNDRYTAILMKYFYKYLSEGYDKAVSLQMAKRKFIKNHSPNPYYWAAFVISGDTDKINFNTQKPLLIENIVLFLFSGFIFFMLFNRFIRKKLRLQ